MSYPLLNRDFVVVSDGVFPEEVKLNHVFLTIQLRMQLDMFYSQRAAAHSVSCFSFFFLITSSQGKLCLFQDKKGKHFKPSQLTRCWKPSNTDLESAVSIGEEKGRKCIGRGKTDTKFL